MRLITLLLIGFTLINIKSYSQGSYSLLGEGNQKRVSLLWSVDVWNNNIEGVRIKRRVKSESKGQSDWQYLTQTILIQSNAINKSLDNVSNKKSRIKQLISKREILFTNTNGISLIEQGRTNLGEELSTDDKAYKMLNLMFLYDFDVALMFGFGFEDYDLPKEGSIEYGLFSVINGIESSMAIATFMYQIGNTPDLNVNVINEKIKQRNNNFHLQFSFSGKELDSKNTLAGFNIYRKVNDEDFIKITPEVIWLSKNTEKRILNYSDKIKIKEENKYTYAVVPVSIFKNEGKYHEIIWSKENEIVFTPPVLDSKQSKIADFINEGVELVWDFNKDIESEIEGFLVQRKAGYETSFMTISDTLKTSVREYIDLSLNNPLIKNYSYRILTIVKDSYTQWSNTKRFYYNPKPQLNNNVNLITTTEVAEENCTVNFSWESDPGFIDKIKGFVLYCDRSGGILAREAEYSSMKSTSTRYQIEGKTGETYKFTLKYENLDGAIENYSDTIEVVIPNVSLPDINIWPFSIEDSKITIEWKYPTNLIDLKGFRVYVNNVLVGDEVEIQSMARSWESETLEKGSYDISIEAISEYGIVSKRSSTRKIRVL